MSSPLAFVCATGFESSLAARAVGHSLPSSSIARCCSPISSSLLSNFAAHGIHGSFKGAPCSTPCRGLISFLASSIAATAALSQATWLYVVVMSSRPVARVTASEVGSNDGSLPW